MDVSADQGFRRHPAWLPILLALLFTQCWLTLRLFGPDQPLHHLLSEEPILSGRHPLHLYHGLLGAKTWLERATGSSFDPAFQAGYLKTPVFDGGCRLAELFLVLGGSENQAAYKIGFAFCCGLLPWCFVLSARGFGFSAGASCLCGFFGCVLFWTPSTRVLLERGDPDLIFGAAAVLVHLGWLTRYSRHSSPGSWLVMTLSASVALYIQPLLSVAFTPMVILWFLWVAGKHGLAWSLAFVGGAMIVGLVNLVWLWDWFRYSWICLPGTAPTTSAIDLEQILQAMQQTIPSDPLRIGLFGLSLVGLPAMLRQHRGAVVLLIFSWLGLIVVSSAAKTLPPLRELGAEYLLDMAGWWSIIPAGFLPAMIAEKLGKSLRSEILGTIWLFSALAGVVWVLDLPQQWYAQQPLEVGLSPRRREILQALEEKTTPLGRILWEERNEPEGWTALLPVWTNRQFLGGLDPEGQVEHLYARLHEGRLCGKPLSEWKDDDLQKFFLRYNITSIVCRTAASWERLKRVPGAFPIMQFNDDKPAVLLEIRRTPNLFLKGQGRVVQIDWQRVALADVIPENGEVVLSLHFQSGWRVSPAFVHAERDIDLDDPIPLMRLKLPGPVSRLTLTWENN